ncbi:hypothetical protein DVH24_002354 [Malus domestica]|uniref:Uncharacterized protein n=1 Tax=Malus domestica TaxID=3750 RepID=A0A498I5Q4_MALDO|nr:hypothetical protein DVH24_002354 [Malus domestica]
MCLMCTCSLPYSMRPFGNSLASDPIRTPNPRIGDPLGSSRVETQKQNREGMVSPERTISCYGEVESAI